jgi:restriction system protein
VLIWLCYLLAKRLFNSSGSIAAPPIPRPGQRAGPWGEPPGGDNQLALSAACTQNGVMSGDEQSLYERVRRFSEESPTLDLAEAERRFLPILRELMDAQGFEMVPQVRPDTTATDFIGHAKRGGVQEGRIGVELKLYNADRPAGVMAVEQVLTAAQRADLDRVVLLSQSGFTQEALDRARQTFPVALELLTFDDILVLARAVDAPAEAPSSQIATLIRRFSEEAARCVAQNPCALDDLEWRDIERMMATVLEALGFHAELTPASKDGGKDIILTLQTESGPMIYIVELKHWRSGKRVGENSVREFVNVVVREQREGGLFLSTYGFTDGAFETLTEIERNAVRFGGNKKVVSLCRSFVRVGAKLWSPDDSGLADVLFSDTT